MVSLPITVGEEWNCNYFHTGGSQSWAGWSFHHISGACRSKHRYAAAWQWTGSNTFYYPPIESKKQRTAFDVWTHFRGQSGLWAGVNSWWVTCGHYFLLMSVDISMSSWNEVMSTCDSSAQDLSRSAREGYFSCDSLEAWKVKSKFWKAYAHPILFPFVSSSVKRSYLLDYHIFTLHHPPCLRFVTITPVPRCPASILSRSEAPVVRGS